MANQRTRFSRISRHPALVALLSIVLGTWLFGQYDYLQKSHDNRRDKSVAFLEETSKNFNGVLTDIFLCLEHKKKPADDSLRKSCNDLFKQRFVVAIKSEAFLQSPTFSREYDRIVEELEDIIDLLYEANPSNFPLDQIKTKTDDAWRNAQGLLSKALSDAMPQSNSDLASKVFLPGSTGILPLVVITLPILGLIFWKKRKRTSDHGRETKTEK